MIMKQKISEKCCICGELTKYICIDCSIDSKGFIPLCEVISCRDKHDIQVHNRNERNERVG